MQCYCWHNYAPTFHSNLAWKISPITKSFSLLMRFKNTRKINWLSSYIYTHHPANEKASAAVLQGLSVSDWMTFVVGEREKLHQCLKVSCELLLLFSFVFRLFLPCTLHLVFHTSCTRFLQSLRWNNKKACWLLSNILWTLWPLAFVIKIILLLNSTVRKILC